MLCIKFVFRHPSLYTGQTWHGRDLFLRKDDRGESTLAIFLNYVFMAEPYTDWKCQSNF